ncbi:hypothetical protein ABUK73_17915 [Agrobacterium sp. BA1120]|uniref:hypothetical protein n=1 Tax=Agrobacterium sp. BA1120 TaxID=3228927 RepID=UPI00336A2664
MMMSALHLFAQASKTGAKLITIRHDEAEASGLEAGIHIFTDHFNTPYEITSGSKEAVEVTTSLLNAETDNDFAVFTSRYGPLRFTRRFEAGMCTLVREQRFIAQELKNLNESLQTGGFTDTNPPPSGLVMSPFTVGFNLWLKPKECSRGFNPVFMTYSLYCFISSEIITRAMAGRPLLVCENCAGYYRPSRRDTRFCGGRCRTAHSRLPRVEIGTSESQPQKV